jgi:hypothetical protein
VATSIGVLCEALRAANNERHIKDCLDTIILKFSLVEHSPGNSSEHCTFAKMQQNTRRNLLLHLSTERWRKMKFDRIPPAICHGQAHGKVYRNRLGWPVVSAVTHRRLIKNSPKLKNR